MNFTRWIRNFPSSGDDLLATLKLSGAQLNDFKTFRDTYVADRRMYGLRWTIPTEEIVEAYYVANPRERLMMDLTIAEFETLQIKKG